MKVHLILDAASVSRHVGVRFGLNQAVKHADNPLLVPGEPHEWDGLQIAWPATVLHDEQAGLYRCWYHGLNALQADRPQRQPSIPWQPGYAESRDGIHWTKPPLGQVAYRGEPTNQIGNDFDGWIISTVFFNPDRGDEQNRFLSIWKTRRSASEPQMPRALAGSPDGLRWRLIRDPFYSEPPPRHQMQDFWQVVHDPAAPPDFRIRAYSQYHANRWDGLLVRQIGLHHGPDILSLRDHEPPVILAPQRGIDDQLHFATVLHQHGRFMMLFESDRFDAKPIEGDLRLAVSEDGSVFRRVHEQTPVLARGRRGEWDAALLVTTTAGVMPVGDELRIYYHGCPREFCNWPGGKDRHGMRGSLFYPTSMGLAILPRDRWACAQGPGWVELNDVPVAADDLMVNADGDVRITCGNSRGGVDGRVERGVYRRVRWQEPPPERGATLRIELGAGQKLFSLAWTRRS